jgi:hypothetical protein
MRHQVKGVLTESKKIVIDLGGVNFIDSSGLGVLAGLFTSALQRRGRDQARERRSPHERRHADDKAAHGVRGLRPRRRRRRELQPGPANPLSQSGNL